MKDSYDVIVAGSGLAGLTAATRLAGNGWRVLLAEQHSQLGGLATWFRRRHHVFDVSLHGFPIGMKKSLRKYWGPEFAERIVQVRRIRFDNPQFRLETTFDRRDFTRILTETFAVPAAAIERFFSAMAAMNYYDDRSETIAQFFERFFPDRSDVWRLLMEPITYANGSTLADPAISYGIVFGNFMSKGVYTFLGGTDTLLDMMAGVLRRRGVDCETSCRVDKVLVADGVVRGAVVNGAEVRAPVVISNGNLLNTVRDLVGAAHVSEPFRRGLDGVRLSNSSCQVYIGIRPGAEIPDIGDLLFLSSWPVFDADAICSRNVTSRTFSVYYPRLRPGTDATCTVVASTNSHYRDWADLTPAAYRAAKKQFAEQALDDLARYVPDIRDRVDHLEAATPRTFARYTLHRDGASFGTKFDGLEYSMGLSREVSGMYHTGSVGIIMSGWLGAANYGVITAHDVDKYLRQSVPVAS